MEWGLGGVFGGLKVPKCGCCFALFSVLNFFAAVNFADLLSVIFILSSEK